MLTAFKYVDVFYHCIARVPGDSVDLDLGQTEQHGVLKKSWSW